MSLIQSDLEKVVADFISKSEPNDRYTSFDYCYNYFRTTDNFIRNVEKSCLTLGFYLASWGMFRGSSFLLQKSVKSFEPTIRRISTLDKSVWNIDADNYTDENIHIIIDLYNDIKCCLISNSNADLVLITKILLGVFGFVPAFDRYFADTFRDISSGQCGFRRVNNNALSLIKDFYEANHEAIDRLSSQTFTTDFLTGQKTKVNYPKAKIIDMYGFSVGLHKSLQEL